MLPDEKKDYNFVGRTQENLKFVSKLMRGEQIEVKDFYDFTNLMNSCLGLLSYVYEYVFDDIERNNPKQNRTQLTSLTMQKLGTIIGNNSNTSNYYETITKCSGFNSSDPSVICIDMPNLLRHMRNAICHGHIQPIPIDSSNRTIVKVSLWDEPLHKQNKDDKNFEIVMTLEQLENFANEVSTAYNIWKETNK